MVVQSRVTAEEFEKIAELRENRDKRLEYIGGEVIEVVTDSYASEIALAIGAEIRLFVKVNKLGRVTGADGGYQVSGDRYIPDVAFISQTKQPKPSRVPYNPNPPDLAVEVISPTDVPSDITRKVVNYLAAGTVVWVVYPEKKEASVYEPGKAGKTVTINDELDGGNVLPGFKLPLKDIFTD